MLRIIRERFRQKYRTMRFPAGEPPALPARFRGLPVLDSSRCVDGCAACVAGLPDGGALLRPQNGLEASTWANACSAGSAPPPATAAPSPSRATIALPRAARDLVIGDGQGLQAC